MLVRECTNPKYIFVPARGRRISGRDRRFGKNSQAEPVVENFTILSVCRGRVKIKNAMTMFYMHALLSQDYYHGFSTKVAEGVDESRLANVHLVFFNYRQEF